MKTRHRKEKKLRFEGLEGRLALSSVGLLHPATFAAASIAPQATSSSNWSGYAAESSLTNAQQGSVSAVSGSWTVPAVTSTNRQMATTAVWVGIDGYSSSTVEQIGTESDVVNGTPTYYAWYEMYPQDSVEIPSMKVAAGDNITASVQYISPSAGGAHAGQFMLTITDTTEQAKGVANESVTYYEGASQSQRSSAEWIVEAPSSNTGVLPLANFSTVTFSNASATINGTTGPIDAFANAQIDMSNGRAQEDSTSAVSDSGSTSGFTVTYTSPSSGSTTPTPHSRWGGWGWGWGGGQGIGLSQPGGGQTTTTTTSTDPTTTTTTTTTTTAAATTTTLTTSVPSTSYGQQVTLTAVVQPSSGSGPVTGEVQFLDGGAVIGTAQLNAGQAVLTVSNLAVGAHTLTAEYVGDTDFATSSSTTPASPNLTVNAAGTYTLVTLSANPVAPGNPVTFTAHVSSQVAGGGSASPFGNFGRGGGGPAAAAVPDGTVLFTAVDSTGQKITGTGTVENGVATFSTSALAAGAYTVTAVYQPGASGDYATSTSQPVAGQVSSTLTPTKISVTMSPQSNLTAGDQVTYTVTVSAAGRLVHATPSGTLTFVNAVTGEPLSGTPATITLDSSGKATFTTTYTTDKIIVTYVPDATGAASFASSQAVLPVSGPQGGGGGGGWGGGGGGHHGRHGAGSVVDQALQLYLNGGRQYGRSRG